MAANSSGPTSWKKIRPSTAAASPRGLTAQPTTTQRRLSLIRPRGRPGPRRSPMGGGGYKRHEQRAVRVRTLTAHPAPQLPPFVGVAGSIVTGSVAPPLTRPLAPPPVTSFGAEPNRSPSSSSMPLSFHHHPLIGSVRPSSPKTRAHDPCRLERRIGLATE
jgi:hypothetical protein